MDVFENNMRSESYRLGGVLLAAGEASRMGQPKQLLVWNGKTLLEHAIETAQSCTNAGVVVVTGAYTAPLEAVIRRYPQVKIAWNANWSEGMATSIRCGVEALLRSDSNLDAILIMLVDQPLIQVQQIKQLITSFEQHKPSYVAAFYEGKAGVPALFSKNIFADLCRLKGQSGAKALFLQSDLTGVKIPMPEAACDVDTPEEWEQFLQKTSI